MIETECGCGRTSLRLDGIAGRIGDAVKVRGMFVAPSQMKRMAGYFPDLKFQMVVERSSHEDSLTFLLQGPLASSQREETGRRFREQLSRPMLVCDRPPGMGRGGRPPGG